MRRSLLFATASVCVAFLLGGTLTTRVALSQPRSPAVAAACVPSWRNVASPKVSQGTLNAVSALSATYAWAVGGVIRLGGTSGGEVVSSTPLIEHWNGRSWSVAAGPQFSGDLTDVAVTSPRDAWAVGFVPRTNDPLLLHWDGRRWSQMELAPGTHAARAVAALSAKNVWIVGTSYAAYSATAEISHWDGRSWTRVARPHATLSDISAVSARDIWAVGATPGDELGKALMLHWNGSSWKSFVRKPSAGNDDAWLGAVHAISSTDVFTGGGEHEEEMSPPAIGPLMLHWDGNRWSGSRLGPSGETEFVGITALSQREAWAVSSNDWSYEEQGGFGYGTWHRASSSWNATELPPGWELYDIAAAPSRAAAPTVWAVGQIGSRIIDYATRTVPLVRRYDC